MAGATVATERTAKATAKAEVKAEAMAIAGRRRWWLQSWTNGSLLALFYAFIFVADPVGCTTPFKIDAHPPTLDGTEVTACSVGEGMKSMREKKG
jgi:hypothetical protein